MKKFCTLLLPTVLFTFTVFSQTLLPDYYGTNDQVSNIERSGNTVYIGGAFTYVGPIAPYAVSLNITSGAPDLSFAKPNGSVNAVVSDGSGGWYIQKIN